MPLLSEARYMYRFGWSWAKCLASAGAQIRLHEYQVVIGACRGTCYQQIYVFSLLQTGKGLAERPPFTLADIKNAIPAHCWKKDAWRSMSYLARDVAIVVGMAAAAYSINSWCLPSS